MLFPPSLPPEIRVRAFRAMNGELGIRAEDVEAFLDICDADGVDVLGWELWLADHAWVAPARVDYVPGSWSGGIPGRDGHPPAVAMADGNSHAARAAIARLSLDWVEPAVAPYLRFNFALDPVHRAKCRNWLKSFGA
jgi:hypothetical protein